MFYLAGRYNFLGITTEGKKEILGMYVSQSEGAYFLLSVLADLQTRGIKDFRITYIDNLKGLAEAISTLFVETVVQSCIVQRIYSYCSEKYSQINKFNKIVSKNCFILYYTLKVLGNPPHSH